MQVSKKRVVITGIGIISSLGLNKEETFKNLIEGRSGIKKITKFDASSFPVQIAGEVQGFEPEKWMDPKEARRNDTFIHYAIAATKMALEDANYEIKGEEAERVAVVVGSGIGGLPWIEKTVLELKEKGHRRVSPFFIPGVIVNLASGQIAIMYGAKGPNSALCTACATANHSIGEALRILQYGEADVAITGGTEAVICPIAVAGFASMRALSTRNDEPEKASRPWDLDRDGFVMGEGAGILIIETLEHALSRNAKIYAEIIGFGMSGDAYHISAPSEDGDGPIRAMKAAIKDANIETEKIDYINAHGTSTPAGDKIETLAIKKLFGEHAYNIQIHSTKSMIGHLLGAAGGVETAVAAMTLKEGIVHPTINQEKKDPDCDLNYTPNKSIKKDVKYCLKNSFGFGGTNACLVLKKWEE